MSVLVLSCLFSTMTFAKSIYGELLCTTPGFSCLHIKKGTSWTSLWPDVNQRQLVMRINRMNTSLHPGMTIAVPNDLTKKELLDFSPFEHQIAAPGEKVIIFDPNAHAWAAYDQNGALIKWGPASGGSLWCSDIKRPCKTSTGIFRIYAKEGSDCISHKFPLPNGGAPMPYCMFFNDGYAFHGSPNEVPGFNASHGCVRLFVDDARWLNQEFVEIPNATNGNKGTKVIIKTYPAKSIVSQLDTLQTK